MCICEKVCDGTHPLMRPSTRTSTCEAKTTVHTIRMRKLEIKLIFAHSASDRLGKTQSYAVCVCRGLGGGLSVCGWMMGERRVPLLVICLCV